MKERSVCHSRSPSRHERRRSFSARISSSCVEIGDVVELGAQPRVLAGLAAVIEGIGELAHFLAEGDLLVVAQVLLVEDDDRVSVERALDGSDVGGVGHLRVDAVDLGEEQRMHRIDRDQHFPLSQASRRNHTTNFAARDQRTNSSV